MCLAARGGIGRNNVLAIRSGIRIYYRGSCILGLTLLEKN